jgi:hypothetical protein
LLPLHSSDKYILKPTKMNKGSEVDVDAVREPSKTVDREAG